MTHVLHCDGVLLSPCGTGARYWHDKRNKKNVQSHTISDRNTNNGAACESLVPKCFSSKGSSPHTEDKDGPSAQLGSWTET